MSSSLKKSIVFLKYGLKLNLVKGERFDVYGKRRIPSSLQKAGTGRLQLAPYKRRGSGDHAGTIPGADAGAGDRIQTPDPGSAAQRSPVMRCAKRRNLKIFSGSPSQIQWKLSTSGSHAIHSIKSTYPLVRMTDSFFVRFAFSFGLRYNSPSKTKERRT